MSATAARLGSAPITIDWTHLSKGSPDLDSRELAQAWAKLKSRFDSGEVGFYDVPVKPELTQAAETQSLADEINRSGNFTDCMILGIGGSALGPISLLSALKDRARSRIRFHFMENPDPLEWKGTISSLRPESTLVCVIAKSGTTFETLAQFQIALEWLGRNRWKSHVVAITDPEKGDLRAFAKKEGIRTLSIAPSMGGRFSVFTPVGLFPAALAGLNLTEFLNGAKQTRDYIERAPHEKNPLFILASRLIAQYAKRPIHVCMPYSTRLKLLGSWFVQLWGESLGKDGKGFTPIDAVGATDQHSILQLLRDGPDDKVTFFLAIDQVEDEVLIPKRLEGVDAHAYPAFAILQGHSLHKLLTIEHQAISMVLTNRGRPHVTIRLDRLDERSMGAVYMAYSVLTAFTGALWGINPFDQPGVEEGKVYIRNALTESQETAFRNAEFDSNSPVSRLRRDRE